MKIKRITHPGCNRAASVISRTRGGDRLVPSTDNGSYMKKRKPLTRKIICIICIGVRTMNGLTMGQCAEKGGPVFILAKFHTTWNNGTRIRTNKLGARACVLLTDLRAVHKIQF